MSGKSLGSAAMLVLADGTPVSAAVPLPVTVDGDVTITGPVTIPGSVEIANDAGNPVLIDPGRGAATRAYGWSQTVVVAVYTVATPAVALPALGASSEVMLHASGVCAVEIGGASVGVPALATSQLRLEAGERFHFVAEAGDTHVRVIGEAAGTLRITPVA